MKRSLRYKDIRILISQGRLICQMCRHTREGEPFAIIQYSYTRGEPREKVTCWRCCRDAESTLLIQQKWPLAFVLIQEFPGYHLEWAPGVKELVGEHGKV